MYAFDLFWYRQLFWSCDTSSAKWAQIVKTTGYKVASNGFPPEKTQSNIEPQILLFFPHKMFWDSVAVMLSVTVTDADRGETNENLFFTAPRVPSIKCSQEKIDDSNKSCHGNKSVASSRCFQLNMPRGRRGSEGGAFQQIQAHTLCKIHKYC